MVYHIYFLCAVCDITYPTGILFQSEDKSLVGKPLSDVLSEDTRTQNVKVLMERDDLRCGKGHPNPRPSIDRLFFMPPN
jgi:hypothetical protein